MKKFFEEPVVETHPFDVEDIIATSNGAPGEGENGTGWG